MIIYDCITISHTGANLFDGTKKALNKTQDNWNWNGHLLLNDSYEW
jgi:hypothetical protein